MTTPLSSSNPLLAYRVKHGLTYAALGERFGLNKTSIRYWERNRVPAERVLEVSRVLGIPRYVLRPDIYPPPVRQK